MRGSNDEHDVAFECTLGHGDGLEDSWQCLSRLTRAAIAKGELVAFWEHKKTLSPQSLLKALFTESVLNSLKRELRRKATVRMDLEDIANALRRLLNPEVLTEDIRIKKARKKKRVVGPAAPTQTLVTIAPVEPGPSPSA